MSDIIKNLFSGKKEASKPAKVAKFCGICQEAFSRDKKDDFKLEYCAECHKTDKISAVAHWKNHFATVRANTLPPNLLALKNKLAKNRALVEGIGMSRVSEAVGSERSLREIVAEQSGKHASFEVIRDQVAELLPSVLAEMGLTEKLDAELLLDAIVPTKIASPIVNASAGRQALRDIVAEAVEHLNMGRTIKQEALIRPHGETKKAPVIALLSEGIQRVSNDYGNRTRRIANPLEAIQPSEPESVPPMDMQDQTMGDFAPTEDDQQDNSGEVVHLPDDEANQLVQDKSNGAPGAEEAPVPPPDMLNEGIGTYSGAGGEAQTPDSSEMEEMPEEGVKRIESSVADFISRRIVEKRAKVKRPADAELFMFAGKLQSNVPAQIVRLAEKDRNVIDSHPPLNYMTAAYNDGSKRTFKYYATDRGYLFLNDDFSVHSTSEAKFASFIESDSSFVKWAFLPDNIEPDAEDGPMAPEHDVEDMALPEVPEESVEEISMGEVPLGEGDPGFNDIKETHLNSSPDNAIGGLVDDQQAIFDNGDPGVGGPELADHDEISNPDPEEAVVDTASDLLPHIEKMFPGETPEARNDMAISAAFFYLNDKGLKKKANDFGTQILNEVPGGEIPDYRNPEKSKWITNTGETDGYGALRPDKTKQKSVDSRRTLTPLKKSVQPPSTVAKNPSPTPPAAKALPSQATTALNPATRNPVLNPGGGSVPSALTGPPKRPALPTKSPLALPSGTASLIRKAATLMPYINDVYAAESEQTRIALALEAAKSLVKKAEPTMEAPAPAAPVSKLPDMLKDTPQVELGKQQDEAAKTRKVRSKNQTIGNDASIGKIKPEHIQSFMERMAPIHPDFAAAASDPEKSRALVHDMARGNHNYGGVQSTTGPKFDLSPTDAARSGNVNKAFDRWSNNASIHAHELLHPDEAEDNPNQEFPGVKQKLRKKLDEFSATNPRWEQILPPGMYDKLMDSKRKSKGLPSMVRPVQPKPGTGEAEGIPIAGPDYKPGNYPDKDKPVEPFVPPAFEKQPTPPDEDPLAWGNKERARRNKEREREKVNNYYFSGGDKHEQTDPMSELPADKRHNLQKSLTTLKGLPGDLSQMDDTQLSLGRGAIQNLFQGMAGKSDEEKLKMVPPNLIPMAKQILEQQNALPEDDKEAKVPINERDVADKQRQMMQASKINEIRKIYAGFTAKEFELTCDALLDFGYSQDQIVKAYAKMSRIAEDDGDVFGATGAVKAIADTFGETSEEAKRGLR